MKDIFKKVSCFCASILCAAALVLGTAGAVWADVDDTLKAADDHNCRRPDPDHCPADR